MNQKLPIPAIQQEAGTTEREAWTGPYVPGSQSFLFSRFRRALVFEVICACILREACASSSILRAIASSASTTSDSSTHLSRQTSFSISCGDLPLDSATITAVWHIAAYFLEISLRPGNSGFHDLAALAISSSRGCDGLELAKRKTSMSSSIEIRIIIGEIVSLPALGGSMVEIRAEKFARYPSDAASIMGGENRVVSKRKGPPDSENSPKFRMSDVHMTF